MKELKATKGNYLTQVDDVGDERIYVTALKGAKLNVSDWREATQEEKDEYEKSKTTKEQTELKSATN